MGQHFEALPVPAQDSTPKHQLALSPISLEHSQGCSWNSSPVNMVELPVVGPGQMKQIRLLPWNLQSLTPGSSFKFISSFAFLIFL